jgi:hypothetical protein
MSRGLAVAGLALAGLILAWAPGCGRLSDLRAGFYSATAPSGKALAMRTIEQGSSSQITEDREFVIRTQQAWKAFYQQHRPGQEVPPVDFSREMAIGVLLARNTGGYTTTIDLVSSSDGTLRVHYVEKRPGPDAIVIQVLTQPYHFVAVPLTAGEVAFEHLTQDGNAGASQAPN